MKKDPTTELWQLKTGLMGIIGQLNDGVEHLDTLSSKTISRALAELMQEVVSMPKSISQEKIAQFARDVLAGTDEMQQDLAAKWYDELTPLMERADQRAASLGHQLGGFTCLSVDGQEWGAVCIKCTQWVVVSPKETRGVLLDKCTGWMISWK